ncbi:hypothetical protein DFH08DRAFT_1047090 [Mycena albidolilacea]|uniref:Uncharacterized protein n=1 Tax=Mycena albidolilacea TaxID=1033008 RepID=A0AAD7AE88_9AGAR|nr:hypothetical protein DFH08DRAFT_1047090 [Mycena albidolilacea]
MALDRSILFLQTAGSVAGMLPVVGEQMKAAVELASTICELVKTFRRNREDWVALAEHAALTTSTMKEGIEEGEAISSVACEKAATVLYEIKDSIPGDRSLAAQTLHATGEKEKIDSLRLKLADSMGRFGVAAQMHMMKTRSIEVTTPVSPSFFVPQPIEPATKVRYRVPFLGEDGSAPFRSVTTLLTSGSAILESLAPVDEARFDHETSADSCLQGTREAMLNTIFEWIDSLAPGPHIFWLAGLAGTGKTTSATTVCEELELGPAFRPATLARLS